MFQSLSWRAKANLVVRFGHERARACDPFPTEFLYINCPGHMTKMAAMAINRKNLKNILLQNQKAYDFETWHEASGRGALQSLYKS